jgi:hypothetical protein
MIEDMIDPQDCVDVPARLDPHQGLLGHETDAIGDAVSWVGRAVRSAESRLSAVVVKLLWHVRPNVIVRLITWKLSDVIILLRLTL